MKPTGPTTPGDVQDMTGWPSFTQTRQSPDAKVFTTRPSGFMGIAFGSNQETVKKQLPSQIHARLDRLKSRENHLWFEGGRFAGFKTQHVVAEFINDRLWNITVTVESQSKDHSKEFAAFRQMLTEKYGAATADEPGEGQIARWSFTAPEGAPETIRIHSQPFGPGMIVWYLRESVRTSAPTTVPEPPTKPAATSQRRAKDDL